MVERWDVQLWEDDSGNSPAEDWIRSLSPTKRHAVIAAVQEVLARDGTGVCATEWGKNLGGGLYEFRIRHTADEIRRMRDSVPKAYELSPAEQVLLRVYFTTGGRKVILLFGGYDKGRGGGGKAQEQSIARARKTLRQVRGR